MSVFFKVGTCLVYDHYIELNQMDSQMSISHGPSTHTTWCTRSHKISTAIKANSNLRMQQQVRIVTTKSFRLHFGRPKMLKLSHWVNLRTKNLLLFQRLGIRNDSADADTHHKSTCIFIRHYHLFKLWLC